MNAPELIVASASPRRRALLEQAGYRFTVLPSKIDETLPKGLPPAEAVAMLASRKAQAVAADHENAVILGCDTVVALENQILEKPRSTEEAKAMLERLSGKTHTVYTGVCLLCGAHNSSFVSQTDVTFYPLSAQTIESYAATGEPMDKAGAYGIQGLGGLLVKEISGDYYTVVGLPLAETCRRLRAFGVEGAIRY